MSARLQPRLLGVALLAGTASAQARQDRVPYRDPSLPIERRVEDLLGRMTLEEKVGQMLCLWQGKRAITHRDRRFDPSRAPKLLRNGGGRLQPPGAGDGARAEAGVA